MTVSLTLFEKFYQCFQFINIKMNTNVEQLQNEIKALRQELERKENLLQQIQISETVKPI